ncbi:hypothetical protein [Phenylobacterium sp.]|jgi:hypothetical protein|uniref:hypothetical protein n=1 Tax=Phenylobacterium sp. TaxID=1871053 RepID=UPI002F41405F
MGKLFFAAAASVLAFAAGAQAMPQPGPQAVLVPVKVEQVTAAAHLTYRDTEHNTLFEADLVTVGEIPMAEAGCRMRDSAQDAAPSAPKTPTSTPRAPPRSDEPPMPRPKGRWTACS